jgi:Protein of unknown function (DUF3300)
MCLANHKNLVRLTSLLCVALLIPGDITLMAQDANPAPAAVDAPAPLPPEELDSLVAPIALYPDPLLAQVLAASTYPLEIVQLQQWLDKHKDLNEKALADAVQKENWDPSIQGMAALPDVVKRLADNISWTSELGNAFLAQESDVMSAVQRMRLKAKDSGKLTSSQQIKVETRTVESQPVVVIEQANPQVIYVPSYDPTVVWGAAPVYAYPPVYYPPAGYYAAGMALSFGVGVAMGAMWGGGWGYNCGWGGGGHNNININNNNNFNRVSNRNNIGNGNRANAGNGNWQHNPAHRGGAPYGDRATARQYGGTARGDSLSNRQASARQNNGLQRQNNGGQRTGAADRSAGVGNRTGAADRSVGGGNNLGRGSGGGGAGGGNRGSIGGDRVGNREIPSGAGNRGSSAFSGGGSSRSSARAASSRGSSSFGGGGGGRSRGGGGGGGRRR